MIYMRKCTQQIYHSRCRYLTAIMQQVQPDADVVLENPVFAIAHRGQSWRSKQDKVEGQTRGHLMAWDRRSTAPWLLLHLIQAQPCPFFYAVQPCLTGLSSDFSRQLYSARWCLRKVPFALITCPNHLSFLFVTISSSGHALSSTARFVFDT